MAGLLTTLGDGVYSATKHAAVGFAEWMAITYGDRGVGVSCVCPGAVNTAMLAGGAGGDVDKAAAAIGGGDVLSPEAVAAEVLAGVVEDRFLDPHPPGMEELRRPQGRRPRTLDPRDAPAVGSDRGASAPLTPGRCRSRSR